MSLDLSTLSDLLQSIVVAVVIVLAVFAWRWLRVALERGQLAAQNEALAQISIYASVFVTAAEQMLSKSPNRTAPISAHPSGRPRWPDAQS